MMKTLVKHKPAFCLQLILICAGSPLLKEQDESIEIVK